jgi:hypothetical protein
MAIDPWNSSLRVKCACEPADNLPILGFDIRCSLSLNLAVFTISLGNRMAKYLPHFSTVPRRTKSSLLCDISGALAHSDSAGMGRFAGSRSVRIGAGCRPWVWGQPACRPPAELHPDHEPFSRRGQIPCFSLRAANFVDFRPKPGENGAPNQAFASPIL